LPLLPELGGALRRVPTVLIYGEHDFVDPAGSGPIQVALVEGDCRSFVIRGGNHHMYARDADVFNRLVAGLAVDDRAMELPPPSEKDANGWPRSWANFSLF
jgi:pimeloyl-ACP methyl ester carboxylesterase